MNDVAETRVQFTTTLPLPLRVWLRDYSAREAIPMAHVVELALEQFRIKEEARRGE